MPERAWPGFVGPLKPAEHLTPNETGDNFIEVVRGVSARDRRAEIRRQGDTRSSHAVARSPGGQ